jgi:hypothetical protein
MKRRQFLAGILPFAAVPHAVAFFDKDDEAHGRGHAHGHGKGHQPGKPEGGEHVRYFRPPDAVLLSRYYPVQSLPPGLRKKYARTGGTIPPGWQKRVQPLPLAVLEQLPPVPASCERGYVDGYAVVYDRTTRVILDSVDLIGALTGR